MSSADEPANEQSSESDEPLGAGFDFTDPNSPLARYYLRLADVLGVLLLVLIAFYYCYLVRLWHTDLWGHAHFGEWILQHRELPRHEPFTPYADPQAEAVHSQWLTQTAYAALIRLGEHRTTDPQRALEKSAELLLTLHQLFQIGLFVFLWLAARRISRSAAWANMALLIAFFLLSGPAGVQRPQLLGMTFFAILIFVLSQPRVSRFAWVGLPLLFALWANVHGSFVVGLAFVLAMVVVKTITGEPGALATGESPSDPPVANAPGSPWKKALLLFLLCLLATFLNPHGPKVFVHVATFAERPNIRDLNEWRPLTIHLGKGGHWSFLIAWGVIVVGLVLGRGNGLIRVLALAPLGLWPLMQERALVWWMMLTPWLLASMGPAITPRLPGIRHVPSSVPSFRKTILAALLIVLFLLWLPAVQWAIRGKPRPLETTLSAATPWKLGLEWRVNSGRWLPSYQEVIAGYPEGQFTGAVFSSETLGDYLLHTAPQGTPILIYTHAHFFPAQHWQESMKVKYAAQGWQAWLRQRHVNLVAIEPDLYPALSQALRQDVAWTVLVDEGLTSGLRLPGERLFVAIRKQPFR